MTLVGDQQRIGRGDRRLVLATTVVVSLGVAGLVWVFAAGKTSPGSLYYIELLLFLAAIAWLGIGRPLLGRSD